MNKLEIEEAIKSGKKLVWNDPDPIEGNDYTIKKIETWGEDCATIQYGEEPHLSEAEVFISEISLAEPMTAESKIIAKMEHFYELDLDNCIMSHKQWIEELAKALTDPDYLSNFLKDYKGYLEEREE